MGRGSSLPRLLAAAGGDPVHEEAEDTGFLYYTRYFRGEVPKPRGPINTPVGTFSILTLPGDNGTWSVTLYASAGDQPLKALRDAGEVDEGRPRLPAPRALARRRRADHARDGDGRHRRPPALASTAMAPDRPSASLSLGDAWACTNPSMGRGMSLGIVHAGILRRVVREHGDRPADLVSAFAAETERELLPWYESTVLVDRERMAQIIALRNGEAPAVSDHPFARVGRALAPAMSRDPDVFRVGAGDLVLPVTSARGVLAARVRRTGAGRGVRRDAVLVRP